MRYTVPITALAITNTRGAFPCAVQLHVPITLPMDFTSAHRASAPQLGAHF